MFDDIVNRRAHNYLCKLIDTLPYQKQVQLRNIRWCGTIGNSDPDHKVYLMRSSKGHVDFFGVNTCHNVWACPRCSAIVMKKYRERIAAAIESASENGLVGFMVTFTVPHFFQQSCEEVTDVLYKSHNTFLKNAFKNRIGKKGNFRSFSPLNRFFHECEIKHYVRVCEHTFGQNGWHPHFHCLFWLPKRNLQKVSSWQQEIEDYWMECVKKTYVKYWQEHNSRMNKHDKDLLLNFYAYDNKNKAPNHRDIHSFYISVNEKGEVPVVNSSSYLTGWTSDKELTGLKAKKGHLYNNQKHYTPFELLDLAMSGDEQAEKRFLEYLFAITRKPVHHRVNFSRGTGIVAMAKTKLQQEKFSALLKKKSEESMGIWAVYAWFTNDEWCAICRLPNDLNVVENIMYLTKIDRRDLLETYLDKVCGCALHEPRDAIYSEFVEKLFNKELESAATQEVA